MPRRPAALAAAALLPLALALAGCAPTVVAKAAKDANDPLCAQVTVHLPGTAGGLAQRETDAQATGAWGDPERVLLTCGVAVPKVSALPCVEVNGVYWLRDDQAKPLYVFTTYGREPAIDVAIEQGKEASPGNVLYDLTDAVRETKTNGLKCQSVQDTLN
jgi:hypothetical protein